MIEVFGHPNTRSLRVVWLLEEMGLSYNYHLVDFSKGESRSEPYLTINPGGKVPSIKDGELLLTESAAIMNYLAEKYAPGVLIPAPGTKERARYDEVIFFVMTELEQPLWTMAKHKFALAKQLRVPEIMSTAQWEFTNAANLLAGKLGDRDFFIEDHLTAADILAAQTLMWGQAFKCAIDDPRLIAFLDRLRARSSLKKALSAESPAK